MLREKSGEIIGTIATLGLVHILQEFIERPWPVLLCTILGGCLAWWAWQNATRYSRFVIKGWVWAFLLSYIFLFSFMATSDLLSWQRVLVGYEDAIPRNWLGLSRIGDWHYWFAQQAPPPQDLLVVKLPESQSQSLEEARFQLTWLIEFARRNGALGIAFDFYFDNASGIDSLLCDEVEKAWNQAPKPVPILAGYRHQVDNGRVDVLAAPGTPECLSPTSAVGDKRLGHLAVYVESDGRVRSAPLYLAGRSDLKSLDYKIAEALMVAKLRIPENGLVQFLEPRSVFFTAGRESLEKNPSQVGHKFLLVGRESGRDMFLTPFGKRLGVMIHADVVQALRNGRWVQAVSWWWEEVMIFAYCYLIAVLFVQRVPVRRTLWVAIGLTVMTVGIGAVAMWTSLTWIDVAYPVAAVWLLIPLLTLMSNRVLRSEAASCLK